MGYTDTALVSRIALSFETLTPKQVCAAFTRALQRSCQYVHVPKIEINVPIPAGYKEQLDGIEILFGQMCAPYFPGPEFASPATAGSPGSTAMAPAGGKGAGQGTHSGPGGVVSLPLVDEARRLWEGWRDMEEYAREVFPVEEEDNGLDWML